MEIVELGAHLTAHKKKMNEKKDEIKAVIVISAQISLMQFL